MMNDVVQDPGGGLWQQDGWMDVGWEGGWMHGCTAQNLAHSKHPNLLEIVKVCPISNSRER